MALRADCICRKRLKRLAPDQLRQRPHRGAADQRAFVIKQAFCFYCQGAVTGVTDPDQHIADESVAADALDRRFCKSRAEPGIVEISEIASRWRAQFIARGE